MNHDQPLRILHVQYCTSESYERQQALATELQRAAKLSAVDRILWNKKPPWAFIGQVCVKVVQAQSCVSTHIILSACGYL